MIHSFKPQPRSSQIGEEGAYGSDYVAEAIVEDLLIPDVFSTVSGLHGKAGTWAVFKLDLRDCNPDHERPEVKISKVADIPEAQWLNGATLLPSHSVLLMAESLQGRLIACHLRTSKVEPWLEH